jgi:nitrite reductase/ring-hydroxylating ferredoxin subunit
MMKGTVRMEVAQLVQIARSEDVRPQRLTRVVIDGCPLAVIQTRRGYLAFPDACPHRGRQLSAHGGSATEDGVVECLFHACRFDAGCGGAAVAGPCEESLRVIDLIEIDGDLLASGDALEMLVRSQAMVAHA